MRFSTFLLALIPATALAAPIPAPAPGFLDLIGDVVGDIPGVGPVFDAIRNPELTAARFKVVEGLVTTENALNSIIEKSDGNHNKDVGEKAKTALGHITQAETAVKSIGKDILAAKPLQRSDQTTVAQNLASAKKLIGELPSQVKAPSNLTDDINDASDGLARALEGARGVLNAAGLSPADVGLDAPL